VLALRLYSFRSLRFYSIVGVVSLFLLLLGGILFLFCLSAKEMEAKEKECGAGGLVSLKDGFFC